MLTAFKNFDRILIIPPMTKILALEPNLDRPYLTQTLS